MGRYDGFSFEQLKRKRQEIAAGQRRRGVEPLYPDYLKEDEEKRETDVVENALGKDIKTEGGELVQKEIEDAQEKISRKPSSGSSELDELIKRFRKAEEDLDASPAKERLTKRMRLRALRDKARHQWQMDGGQDEFSVIWNVVLTILRSCLGVFIGFSLHYGFFRIITVKFKGFFLFLLSWIIWMFSGIITFLAFISSYTLPGIFVDFLRLLYIPQSKIGEFGSALWLLFSLFGYFFVIYWIAFQWVYSGRRIVRAIKHQYTSIDKSVAAYVVYVVYQAQERQRIHDNSEILLSWGETFSISWFKFKKWLRFIFVEAVDTFISFCAIVWFSFFLLYSFFHYAVFIM